MDSVRKASADLIRTDPNVPKVVLFGSLANGTATAASDADILIVLRDSDLGPYDRAHYYPGAFGDVGLPVELFVHTEKDIARGMSSIAEHSLTAGLELGQLDEASR